MDAERKIERDKYIHVYKALPKYAMGAKRMQDAIADLKWAYELGCRSYLDIGCGRGEMLEHAKETGFTSIRGAEIVPQLYEREDVMPMAVHDLHALDDMQFDCVSCFDVIEHLLPGDDALLLDEMSRIAASCVVVTANNKPSIDPTTRNDLHINKKPYLEWDEFIHGAWDWGYDVEWVKGKQYVSETWRASRL